MINLDHAATTPLRAEALEAMLPYFCEQYANASGSYKDARNVRRVIDCARKNVAQAVGANAAEMYFTSSGTESDNWAIRGVLAAQPDKRHIVTTAVEHHAVLSVCERLEKEGYRVTCLPVDAQGAVSIEAAQKAIGEDTALVSVMLANNEIGTIQPVQEIAKIAHARGVPVHTDAVQAVGHIPVDVHALDVDLLSLSAHKFGGPKGVGALYVRSGTRIDPLILGGAQEKGMRAGTENTPGIVGMSRALSLALDGMERAYQHVQRLRDQLQQTLSMLDGVKVNGMQAPRLPGHLHLTIDGISAQMLLMRLDMAGIAASSASACASGAMERSHVVRAMGMDGHNQADVRFTIGENNTEEEIVIVAETMKKILTWK